MNCFLPLCQCVWVGLGAALGAAAVVFTHGHRPQNHRTFGLKGPLEATWSHSVMVVAKVNFSKMIAMSLSSTELGWRGAWWRGKQISVVHGDAHCCPVSGVFMLTSHFLSLNFHLHCLLYIFSHWNLVPKSVPAYIFSIKSTARWSPALARKRVVKKKYLFMSLFKFWILMDCS